MTERECFHKMDLWTLDWQ